jgi:outer membrane lipoprotein SlyB
MNGFDPTKAIQQSVLGTIGGAAVGGIIGHEVSDDE